MLMSRGVGFAKIITQHVARRNAGQNLTQTRKGHSSGWAYREPPVVNKYALIASELMGGFMWWWILWHLWHDWGHIVGEWGDFPDPSKWTDEELGIPPDDDDC